MSTLAESLAEQRVPFSVLHQQYKPVLELVRVLIGVVPNCDPYLEIWPPGFRTYNLIVPNFLNLPQSLAGRGARKELVGLAMYSSSRAAGCAYCSAHTCSFALRRGSSEAALTGRGRSPVEAAVVAVAEGLSRVPHAYDSSLEEALESHLSPSDAEWVVMGVAMMGFLNKFMDALGVELEPEAIDDVADLIEPTGWSAGQHAWALGPRVTRSPGRAGRPPVDSLAAAFPILLNAMGALQLDRKWLSAVPKDASASRRWLAEAGFDEPLLESLVHLRPRRALAGVLHHNLNPDETAVGIDVKALAGLVFARRLGSAHLVERSRTLATQQGAAPQLVAFAEGYQPSLTAPEGVPARLEAALRLAHAWGPSPAEVDDATIERVESLQAAEVVELAVWVSVYQLIHRLTVRRLARA